MEDKIMEISTAYAARRKELEPDIDLFEEASIPRGHQSLSRSKSSSA